MPERRKTRARPMGIYKGLQNAEANFFSAHSSFRQGVKKSGSRLIGSAARLALAKMHVRQRLFLDAKFNIENDARFNERLFAFLRSAKSRKGFSFAIIDLDYLKKLNKAKGHAVADKAIALLAEKLSKIAKRNGGFAGRFGGDEFKILAPLPARNLGHQLENALEEMKTHGLSFSAGILDSGYLRANGVTALAKKVETMNHLADNALYKSKGAGRGRVTVY